MKLLYNRFKYKKFLKPNRYLTGGMKMGMTMTEKILSAKAGRRVSPGDFLIAEPDLVYAHDGSAPLTIQIMEENPELYRVSDPSKVLLIIDHLSPPPHVEAAKVHAMMRDFARKFGIRLFDVGEGICHQVVPEYGYARPFSLILGGDSHTTTLGAFSAFATGVGSTDIAFAIAFGKTWLRVPETVRVNLDGELKPYISGKDIILRIIKEVSAEGFTYKAVEFHGSSLKQLSVDSRMTISNMSLEAGAKAAIFPTDEILSQWFAQAGLEVGKLYADPDAEYNDVISFELSDLEPQVAETPTVDNVKSITEVEGIEVNQAFIGSCTNGRYEDFLIAAKILRGRKVKENVRGIAIPASRKVYLELLRDGILDIFVQSGFFVAHSTCGPCVGGHLGLLSSGEVAISTSNRNFPGRMGDKESKVYLASPAVVAASAVEGRIADPRKYLGGD
jgi:3-isopropylmalate/(R)-2-methylmalate dehydratase large subunit